jgi:uncharacterized protein
MSGVHILAKPTGAICSLDCKYCFFLSKEMLYPGDRFRMSDELLETYIRQLLESQPLGDVNVAWQGGEPTLMGIDFFPSPSERSPRIWSAGKCWCSIMATSRSPCGRAWRYPAYSRQ